MGKIVKMYLMILFSFLSIGLCGNENLGYLKFIFSSLTANTYMTLPSSLKVNLSKQTCKILCIISLLHEKLLLSVTIEKLNLDIKRSYFYNYLNKPKYHKPNYKWSISSCTPMKFIIPILSLQQGPPSSFVEEVWQCSQLHYTLSHISSSQFSLSLLVVALIVVFVSPTRIHKKKNHAAA